MEAYVMSSKKDAKKAEENWVKGVKENIKEIEKFKREEECNKLDVFIRLSLVHGLLLQSIKGWSHWIGNPYIISSLDKKMANDILQKYMDVALKYLELDVKYTKSIGKKVRDNNPYGSLVEEDTNKQAYRV